MIKQLADQYDNIHFFNYTETPRGWIEEQYDKNSEAWITADSISMVYEAITAGCSVGIFPMEWVRENGKFKRNESILLEKKLVRSFAVWEQGHNFRANDLELNEARRCAEHILRRWWPEKDR